MELFRAVVHGREESLHGHETDEALGQIGGAVDAGTKGDGQDIPEGLLEKGFLLSGAFPVHAARGGLEQIEAIVEVLDGALEAVGYALCLGVPGADVDPKLVDPHVPTHIEGSGADVIVIDEFVLAEVAEEAGLQAPSVVRGALEDRRRQEIGVESPRLDGHGRGGAGLGVVHVRPELPALLHDRERGEFGLALGQATQIGTFGRR